MLWVACKLFPTCRCFLFCFCFSSYKLLPHRAATRAPSPSLCPATTNSIQFNWQVCLSNVDIFFGTHFIAAPQTTSCGMQQGTEVKFTASYHSGVRLCADRLRRSSYTIVLQLQFAFAMMGQTLVRMPQRLCCSFLLMLLLLFHCCLKLTVPTALHFYNCAWRCILKGA